MVHDESCTVHVCMYGVRCTLRVQVVVFTGLFEVTPSEDALASVLGHEVGHVIANHGGEKMSKVR